MSAVSQSVKYSKATKKGTKDERRSLRRANSNPVNDGDESFTSRTTSSLTETPRRRSKKLHLVPKNSANEGVVKNFMTCINNQDVDGCTALLKSPQHCEWRFSGQANITIKQYGDMIQKIVKSFPDFSIASKEVVEVGPGVVQVKHAVASGTHTGEPFGFQCYNPLPATGTKCVNEPEHLTFFIREEKIAQVHVVCTGKQCGPLGLYAQSKNGRTHATAALRSSSRSPSRATAA